VKPPRFHCVKGKKLNWSVDGFSIERPARFDLRRAAESPWTRCI
jgi:hypothetical protein